MSQNPSPEDQREHFKKLLRKFNTAMLVTHVAEGRLRARPMAIAKVEEDCCVWFVTGVETSKTHEIEADTRVHVVCQDDRSAYLSINGHAEFVRDREKIAELWQEPFRVWFPKGKDDPGLVLIAVRAEEGEFWDHEGMNKIKHLFAAAKAYATGGVAEVVEGEQHGVVRL